MTALRRWWSRRLSSRIFTLFFGLLLAVQLTVLAVVDRSVGQNARKLLAAFRAGRWRQQLAGQSQLAAA